MAVHHFKFFFHSENVSSEKTLGRFLAVMNSHPERFQFEVIDVAEQPEAANEERLLALPTVVRTTSPRCRYVGDLSKFESVLKLEGLI